MDDHSAMLTPSEQIARKFNEAFPKEGSEIQDQQIAAKCSVSKQAVTGWRSTGRIAKQHLPVLAELSHRDLSWWMPNQQNPDDEVKIGSATAQAVSEIKDSAPEQTILSPLMVAATRLDRSSLVPSETKAAITRMLQSLLK